MRFLLTTFCLLISLGAICGAPFEIDRFYDQEVGPAFFQSLVERPGQLRPVFLDMQGEKSPVILYGRFRKDLAAFDFRLRLPASAEAFLTKQLRALPKMRFWARRRDGSILYRRGTMFRGHLGPLRVEYVSHYEDEVQPYLCDAGHLRFVLWSYEELLQKEGAFHELLARLLDSAFVKVAEQVRLNRYYQNRPSFFGHVHHYLGRGPRRDDFVAQPITHKVTLNKGIFDQATKRNADRNLCLRLLQPFAPLLSQDERVKLELVPEFVELRPLHLTESDLACGQNIYVFLTAGTGINYFDDPWLSERKNVPSPRFIFDQSVAFYEQVQLYPSYAIATAGGHNSRFAEINEFQGKGAMEEGRRTGFPAFMELDRRRAYWNHLEAELGQYGLLNDSPILEVDDGFEFWGQKFRGNVVNNELRLTQAAYPLYETCALVVPKGQGEAYRSGFATLVATGTAIPFIGGIHYRDYFIEAVEDSDKAMRCAVFEEMVRRCRPSLWLLLQRARKRGEAKARESANRQGEVGARESASARGESYRSYYNLAQMGAKLFARLGRSFFSPEAMIRDRERRYRWQQWMAQMRMEEARLNDAGQRGTSSNGLRLGVKSRAEEEFLEAYRQWRVSE